ncbi:hypothetical protein HUJ05_001954 [Dendroctonus ponderosae]|nr:hypothetical protein HUJ05_001954 [Dendroctonus ponderosae]
MQVRTKTKKIDQLLSSDSPYLQKLVESSRKTYRYHHSSVSEADIRRKLMENQKETFQLPADWDIPLTSQRCDFRPPLVLSQQAMDKPLVIKHPDNLGENGKPNGNDPGFETYTLLVKVADLEKINDILQVKTGDSEYNQVIGKLGDFIVNEEMHGKIDHPECGCLQHK